MSNDPRLGVIQDYAGERPCNEPMILGRLLDKLAEGRGLPLLTRICKTLAELNRKLTR